MSTTKSPTSNKSPVAKKAVSSAAKTYAAKRRDLSQRLKILKREAKELSDNASGLLSRISS